MVILYHVDKYYIGRQGYWPESAVSELARFGHAGVEFFFVLSGYMMFAIHQADFGRPGAVRMFARKRFERLYPLFWCVLLASVVLYAIFPSMGEAKYRDPRVILESALLVGRSPFKAVVFVSWSLWHEVLFYAVFVSMIWKPRAGVWVFGAWIALCGADPLLRDGPLPPYWTAFINVLFAMGCAVAFALKRSKIAAPRLTLAVGCAAFLGLGLLSNQMAIAKWVESLGFGLASAVALLGAVESERQGLLRAPGWLVRLGGASYAIYLTHMLTLPLLGKLAVVTGLVNVVSPTVAFVLLTAGAVAVGLVVHRLVDAPMQLFTRRLLTPRLAV